MIFKAFLGKKSIVCAQVCRAAEGNLCSVFDEELLKDPYVLQCGKCGYISAADDRGKCPHCGAHYRARGLLFDPVECSAPYKAADKALQPSLAKEFNEMGMFPGLCWRMWERKKTLLLQMYHIHWRSPGEMNPGIWFE